jgi:hypothetical protein
MSSTVAVDGLAAFGLKTAPPSGTSTLLQQTRANRLRCSPVPEPDVTSLAFRIEAINHPASANWSEKLFCDAVLQGLEWTTRLGFEKKILTWFDNNIPQLNSKGFPTRMLFLKASPGTIVKENVVRLGEHICEQLNATEGNTTTTSVDESLFFWPGDDPVWSDIVGADAALTMLMKKTGEASDVGYYARNKAVVHSYFRPGTFSPELADILNIPEDQRFDLLHSTYHDDHHNAEASGPDPDINFF